MQITNFESIKSNNNTTVLDPLVTKVMTSIFWNDYHGESINIMIKQTGHVCELQNITATVFLTIRPDRIQPNVFYDY